MSETKRLETLYRVMYESFTPGMMRRAPLWLKQRIARQLGYRLVDKLSADQFMGSLLKVKREELAPMALSMFEECVGGNDPRTFLRAQFWIQKALRIWRGQTHTKAQQEDLAKAQVTAQVKFPGIGLEPSQMAGRRRLR